MKGRCGQMEKNLHIDALKESWGRMGMLDASIQDDSSTPYATVDCPVRAVRIDVRLKLYLYVSV